MRILLVILTTILTSFYFFPFEFKFLPGINTKMVLALLGLILLGIELARSKRASMDKDFLIISFYAALISLMSIASATFNHTNDYSFVGFIVSMWVWLGAAYCVVKWLTYINTDVSVETVVNLLVTVCVAQCVIAYAMEIFPPFRQFVNGFLGGSEAAFGIAEGRLYGIGAALDVAGFRFSAVLVMLAYLCVNKEDVTRTRMFIYVMAFCIISIIGNMISRSTIVGLAISLIYWFVFPLLSGKLRRNGNRKDLIVCFCSILCVVLPIVFWLYNHNEIFQANIRFGFEGFFSLAETGRWQVDSNDILFKHMIVFPDTMKTWIIGDGYSANPYMDPYYVGEAFHGYYKGTDIGYLRFIFYFGILGLIVYLLFIVKSCAACIKGLAGYKMMFLMVLLVNLSAWAKVSTDIFPVFAPFVCLSMHFNVVRE